MTAELIVAIVVMGVFVFVTPLVLIRFFHRVPAHHVLVRTGTGGPRVAREGIVAFPGLHTVEPLDVSVRRIEIDRRNGKGLLAENGDRVELRASFFVKVNDTNEDILKAAQDLGCAVMNDAERFRKHLEPKLVSALEMVARMMTASEIEKSRDRFRDRVFEVIELGSGLRLDDVALDDLRVVPEIAPPYR